MPSGLTFDLFLIGLIVAIAVWEAGVAIRRKEKRRFILVALGLVAAGVLFYLRAPQIFAS
jgi:hypothetical protein